MKRAACMCLAATLIASCSSSRAIPRSRPYDWNYGYFGWRLAPAEKSEVVVDERGKGSSPHPSGMTRLGYVTFCPQFDRAAAAYFAQSIGATVVHAHTFEMTPVDGIPRRRSASSAGIPESVLPPHPYADLEFFGPEGARPTSGFPPEWGKRVRGIMNRRQLPDETSVELIDRSNERNWLADSDRDFSRGGEMDWCAEDQPFRACLPDFARKLGCARVVFAGMWGPGQREEEAPKAVCVWFYRSTTVRTLEP